VVERLVYTQDAGGSIPSRRTVPRFPTYLAARYGILTDMTPLPTFPGFWLNLVTLGIARARWTSATNQQLARGGAGFWFAWFLAPFAYYGVTGRLNGALAAAGSGHRESPLLCFLLTGIPFIGAKKRLRRATERLNDALRVRQAAVV